LELTTKLNLEKIPAMTNIAEELTEDELQQIGHRVYMHFEADLQSRQDWETRNEQALKLALQVSEKKSFPWPGASNIKFPLITIAALQYHARAYPTLINDSPVRMIVSGDDPSGQNIKLAERVQEHMCYQLFEEDESWESQMDTVLITQPIIGCAFKKSYFDPILGHNVSENVLAKDFVVNYWAKSLETAPRMTHVLYMSNNDIYSRVARGLWLEMTEVHPASSVESRLSLVQDKVQGLTKPQPNDESTPYEILEHHCFLDLDDDGYAEPYIVYVRRDTRQVLRIVARFFNEGISKNAKGKVLSIKAEQYFTKFPFIPSPDGGFYDLGFGVLLGPLNESINTLINQLTDAGTMANTAGGFLSRGVKLRGGNYTFAPLEWKHVESTGDDLRKGIMPLPVREPSQVLYTLLNLLINYGERIGISVDILTGQNPGQNTPAETSRTMAEQGMKIFSGIFKRTYRSLRDEFRKLYRLNQLYLAEDKTFGPEKKKILSSDYKNESSAIHPSADPNIISDNQRVMQATAVKQASMSVPGYNRYEVEKLYLKSLRVQGIDQLFPDPKGPNAVPPPPNPKVQIEQMKVQAKMQDGQIKLKLGVLKLLKEAELNQAKIEELNAKAALEMAEAQGVESGHKIALINAQIAATKNHQDHILKSVELMQQIAQTMEQPEAKTPAVPDVGGQSMNPQPQGLELTM
jgi:chaperonin GroES